MSCRWRISFVGCGLFITVNQVLVRLWARRASRVASFGGCCGMSVLVLARVSDPGCAVVPCEGRDGATECWCGCSGQGRLYVLS